ncbi:MAG TPA: hypothetical protein VFK92_12515 [Burkholderiales bacterium]|nr:hypothetical protein [Burkholderiales bacterium]
MSQVSSMIRALAAALFLGSLPAVAQAQSRCLVADPELQDAYEGGCVDGKAEGQGTARGSATYTGEFHLGKKQGRGVKVWSWGDRYEGGFADDYKSGWGAYTWGERTLFAGERYEGGFAGDRRNGFGVYTWASGDSYAGPWKDDAIVGPASPMLIARFRATSAAMEALAKPGVKVCHESVIGSGSAAATEAETRSFNPAARQVSIEVTKLGPSPTLVAGAPVAVGDVVWDDPLHWIPCN